MSGLEGQLGGMGVAFASSLLGLAGSLVVGLLELFAGHGQNRFYRELEEWLSSITRIGVSAAEGGDEMSGAALGARTGRRPDGGDAGPLRPVRGRRGPRSRAGSRSSPIRSSG